MQEPNLFSISKLTGQHHHWKKFQMIKVHQRTRDSSQCLSLCPQLHPHWREQINIHAQGLLYLQFCMALHFLKSNELKYYD